MISVALLGEGYKEHAGNKRGHLSKWKSFDMIYWADFKLHHSIKYSLDGPNCLVSKLKGKVCCHIVSNYCFLSKSTTEQLDI